MLSFSGQLTLDCVDLKLPEPALPKSSGGLGFRVWGLGFRVLKQKGFRVKGLGFISSPLKNYLSQESFKHEICL